MKIYIISSFRNKTRNEEVTKFLEEEMHIVHLPQRDTPQDDAREMFKANIRAIENSDTCIVIGESYGKGSSFEMGYARASGKQLLCLGELEKDDRMNICAVEHFFTHKIDIAKHLREMY